MKFGFLFLLLASFWACTGNDPQSSEQRESALKDTASYTTIQWIDSTSQDLGTVNQGAVVEIKWRFRNSGTRPLVISEVRPGCGCTGAEGPKEPVAPGSESAITAKFDTKNYPGEQHKEVYVTANNRNRNSTGNDVLKFAVDVEPKK